MPTNVEPFLNKLWDDSIIPTLQEFIRIPNLSPDYDADIHTNGLQEKAFALIMKWVEEHKPQGTSMTLHEDKAGKRTPFLHIDIAPFNGGAGHVLMYSHADKQPHLTGWSKKVEDATGKEVELGPCNPVIAEGKLWGRGGVDDGYGVLVNVASVLDVQRRNKSHGHISIIVEGAEESDTDDLEVWLEKHKEKFGPVDFIVVMDSGAADPSRLFLTDALRGVGSVIVKVDTCAESIHSGLGGGAVPDPVRVLRMLLDRLEDTATGALKVPALNVKIPDSVVQNLAPFQKVPHDEFMKQNFSFLPGVRSCCTKQEDNVEMMLATTWMPSMTVVGFDGAPDTASGGNVIRASSAMKLSFRIPPTADAAKAEKEIKDMLTKDAPYGCKVTVTSDGEFCAGWRAPEVKPWFHEALGRASTATFGNTYGAFGCGGSIPFCATLSALYPQAMFCITGVLLPGSNAHVADENLPIEYSKAVNNCVSMLIEDHGALKK